MRYVTPCEKTLCFTSHVRGALLALSRRSILVLRLMNDKDRMTQ